MVITGGGVWKWGETPHSRTRGFGPCSTGDVTWNEPFHDSSTDPDGCNMVRLISPSQPATSIRKFRRILWDGHEGLDWASSFRLKPDTSRISLLYDRTFTFNPERKSGYAQTIPLFWHPKPERRSSIMRMSGWVFSCRLGHMCQCMGNREWETSLRLRYRGTCRCLLRQGMPR